MQTFFAVSKKADVTDRCYGLDFLKIIATIAIVFHHYQQDFEVVFSNHINFMGTWFYWGYMVELFFTLSGYFMVKYIPLIQNNKITFGGWLERRTQRLLPLVAVSAVVYELLHLLYWHLQGKYWFWEREVTIWGVIITGLGLQEGGAFLNPHVNNVTWYISVLLICYGLFFVLTKLSTKLNMFPGWLYIAMVLLGASIKSYELDLPYLNPTSARGYVCFFYGLLLGMFVMRFGITKKEVNLSAALLVFLTTVFVYNPACVVLDLDNILSFLYFPALIILFESNLAKKVFRHAFWGIWGQISYNVYIWHVIGYFLLEIILLRMGISLNYSNPAYMYLYLVFIEIWGIASFFWIERPLNRYVNRIIEDYRLRGRNC